MLMGHTALKMRYLGDGYLGQDLCYAIIDICLNSVTITRRRHGQPTRYKFVEDPAEVSALKDKFRAFFYRAGGVRGWKEQRLPGTVRFVIYYPSLSWGQRTGIVHWMMDGGSF
jgi:hypothetical protein